MKGWSPMEDSKLLQLIETSGKRWKLIAEALGRACPENPRTPAMVRNRYLRIERGRWLTEQGMSKNRCGQCGQLKRGHVCQAAREGGPEMGTVRRGSARDVEESVPDSPFGSAAYSATGKLALGVPPLTYVGMDSPIEDLVRDGSLDSLPAHLSGTPGRTPTSLAGMLAGGTASLGSGPPGLRPQSSFDMLLKASELRSSEQPKILADTPSVLPGEFPFGSVISENSEPSTLSSEDLAGSCATPAHAEPQPAFKLAHANRRVEVEG